MIIIFFTEGKNNPASRFRIEQFISRFRKANIKCIVFPSFPESSFFIPIKNRLFMILINGSLNILKLFIRLLQIPFVFFANLIVIQRELIPFCPISLENLIWKLNKKIIFDFDDAIFLRKTNSDKNSAQFREKYFHLDKIIKNTIGVTAGNEYLANYAKQFNDNVKIIPTVINSKKYFSESNPKHKKNIIGWMGTSGNLIYLYQLIPVLKKIHLHFPEVKLLISADKYLYKREFNDAIPTIFYKWSAENELNILHKIDIGLMPLIDDNWCKGKCGFKLILYMACGIPAVGSDIGVNSKIIINNQNGFLATTDDEWFEKISRLIENKDLLLNFKQAGLIHIKNNYSVNAIFPEIYQFYLEVTKN